MKEPIPKKLNLWWGKIGTQSEALQVIRASYRFFYGIGGFVLAAGLLNTIGVLPEVRAFDAYFTGIVWLVLAFFLHRFNSRVVAVTLVILSAFIAVMVMITTQGKGGILSIPIVVMLWPSIRTLGATRKWHKWQQQQLQSREGKQGVGV